LIDEIYKSSYCDTTVFNLVFQLNRTGNKISDH